MFRRRKRTGIWLPPDPFNYVGSELDVPLNNPNGVILKEMVLNASVNFASSTNAEQALVGDLNEDLIAGQGINQTRNGTLNDLAVGYSLKRIVGKIYVAVSLTQAGEAESANVFMVTAGIIVRRVNDTGASLAQNAGEAFTDTYESARDPWVWRRNWILKNDSTPTPSGFFINDWPSNNVREYGAGIHDGTHVDAKTRRTVKSEERLFLDVTATALNGGTGLQGSQGIQIYYDLRLFGRVFTSAGNRRNASR